MEFLDCVGKNGIPFQFSKTHMNYCVSQNEVIKNMNYCVSQSEIIKISTPYCSKGHKNLTISVC